MLNHLKAAMSRFHEALCCFLSLEDDIYNEFPSIQLQAAAEFQDRKSIGVMENHASSNTDTIKQIPEDLITEILVRLPVKPLMRFKCVSKPWLSLISSPQFMKSHFSKSRREGKPFDCQLLFSTLQSGPKQCSLTSALQETSSHGFDIEYPLKDAYRSHLSIVGIVDGLVCLNVWEDELCLWNPILKKSRHLPTPSSTLEDCLFAYGFGYDESNDDYKVVYLPWTYVRGLVYVYSLRGESWKVIEEYDFVAPVTEPGKYANGKIFWFLNQDFHLGNRFRIFSIDLVTDEFEEVQGPVYEIDNMTKISYDMGVLGDRVSLFFEYRRRKVDLWVMDEFGVEESWSKLFSIPYTDAHPASPYKMVQVLYISRNGEQIVFEDKSGLVVYDSTSTEFRNIQLDGSNHIYGVKVYVASFLSPDDL